MDSHYVLTKAEKKDASFTARMKGNFIRSAQRLLPAQMGQYSVDLKNDPVYGFLANNVWVHDSRDGLKVQNELKLHNLKIAVDMQKASVEATDKEMREFAEQDFNPAMQEAERAKEAEARINATEKELKQHIEEEYKKKRAAFEESFAKYRSDMLGDLEERKAESRQRNDDAIRRLNQKTFQARAYVTSLKQQTQHRDVVEKELKEELEAAAEFDFIGCGANNILPGDLTGARIDLIHVQLRAIHFNLNFGRKKKMILHTKRLMGL